MGANPATLRLLRWRKNSPTFSISAAADWLIPFGKFASLAAHIARWLSENALDVGMFLI
jgi:hypothetical protein